MNRFKKPLKERFRAKKGFKKAPGEAFSDQVGNRGRGAQRRKLVPRACCQLSVGVVVAHGVGATWYCVAFPSWQLGVSVVSQAQSRTMRAQWNKQRVGLNYKPPPLLPVLPPPGTASPCSSQCASSFFFALLRLCIPPPSAPPFPLHPPLLRALQRVPLAWERGRGEIGARINDSNSPDASRIPTSS